MAALRAAIGPGSQLLELRILRDMLQFAGDLGG
jgi:hypothetical protein